MFLVFRTLQCYSLGTDHLGIPPDTICVVAMSYGYCGTTWMESGPPEQKSSSTRTDKNTWVFYIYIRAAFRERYTAQYA